MRKYYKLVLLGLVVVGLISALAIHLNNTGVAVLNPAGTVANQERRLFIEAGLLSLVVVLPVFVLTAAIAWKYREGNKKAKYRPNWDGHRGLEFAWWAIPFAIIFILSIITWNSSHQLDPYKALASNNKAINIQVISLDWKWLFIYPDQGIATVNFAQIPKDTPVNFIITSDAPMNSFWVPQLGGQVYAMPGMSTQLHLMADQYGDFKGSSANISGSGFSGMKFIVRSSSSSDFYKWTASVKKSPKHLDSNTYGYLVQPSKDNPVTYYSEADPNLYANVLMQYMSPGTTEMDMSGMGMN